MSVTAPPAASPNSLPIGLRLDEFEIRSVIGEGGFGIVYHAFDHALERDVAIKEYMPSAMAARSATMHVSLLSQGHAETFTLGLQSFVNEARLLARFDHPSLVKVHRFWEGNGTAYMVMPLYRGRTLKALRQGLSASPSESWLRALLDPLLGALELLHVEGVFHRDIAPDNILVGDEGKPVLLDFGAARRVISDQTQTLTAILKPNFAPIEQYAETEGLRQGAWTDLYALGATLHFVITGSPPQPATARAFGSEANLLAGTPRRGISKEFLQTVDWMMAPRPEHRPQCVAALRTALAAGPVDLLALGATEPAAERADAWQHTVAQEGGEAPPPRAMQPSLLDVVPGRELDPEPVARMVRARARGRRWALPVGAALLMSTAAAAWYFVLPHDQPMALNAMAPVGPASAASAASASTAPLPVAAIEPAPDASAASVAAPVSDPQAAAAQTAATSSADAPESDDRAMLASRELPPAVSAAHTRTKHKAKPTDPVAPAPRTEAAVPELSPAVAQAAVASPSELCRGRVLLAWYRCVKRACQASPAFNDAHECVRVRQIEADNARQRSP